MFSNVLLNNYTKNDTDKLVSMKQSRKVSKLNDYNDYDYFLTI